jgi:YwiC-like protein
MGTMTPASELVASRFVTIRHRWLPRQHGGWVMVLLPLLVGVAASRPDPWQLALAGAALAGYIASTTVQAWSRARRPAAYRAPIALWVLTFGVLAVSLAVAFPALLLGLGVLVPTALMVLTGARPGRRRDLANSLAQVAQASFLVPAAALVSGSFEVGPVAEGTLIAGGYLLGTVLVVRSVLRDRGRRPAVAAAAAIHVAMAVAAAVLLPAAYVALTAWLTLRAVALPTVQARLAGSSHPLRPIHIGMVETASSIAVVLVAFAVRP